MNKNISELRVEYQQKKLLETEVDADPIKQFAKWWDEAIHSKIHEVNAMTLATASLD